MVVLWCCGVVRGSVGSALPLFVNGVDSQSDGAGGSDGARFRCGIRYRLVWMEYRMSGGESTSTDQLCVLVGRCGAGIVTLNAALLGGTM